MAITVNTNVASLTAQKSLNNATTRMNTAMERMSTGLRINSSKDDAAGMAVASKLDYKVSSLNVAQDNGQMGASMLDTAEGVLSVMKDNLVRVRDLTEQAANGTYGDDAMKASTYGVKNLKRVMANIQKWNYEEADMDANLKFAYKNVINQMGRFYGHVQKNISGVYHDYKSADQEGPVYTPAGKDVQRRALAWLNENMIVEPAWLWNQPFARRINRVPENAVYPIVDRTLDALTSAMTLNLISKHCYLEDSYKPMDYISELLGYLFRSTKTGAKVSNYTKHIQRRAVNNFARAWRVTMVEDQRPYAYAALKSIRAMVQNAKTSDADTRAHYKDLDEQIRIVLTGLAPQKSSSSSSDAMSKMGIDEDESLINPNKYSPCRMFMEE